MNKVTIRFWDKRNGKYQLMPSWYFFVDRDGRVFCESPAGMDEQVHIEPHFYKDGERIA